MKNELLHLARVLGRAPCRPRLERYILADALRRIAIAIALRTIGIAAVLVHAKDNAAKRFYTSLAEFIEHPAYSRTLFLPIETLTAALS